jgi:hypothetical protein
MSLSKARWALALLLAAFHLAYGIQLFVHSDLAEMSCPAFDGSPRFTPIGEGGVQYATNTSSTILKIDRNYYLWRDGIWYRGSTATGSYRKTAEAPSEALSGHAIE